MTPTINDLLPSLLANIEHPGSFCAHGRVELPVVRLAVEGVGTLGLPIPAVQGEALARLARPAPYGRGSRTLLDASVRRCGQVEAASVRADDPRWARLLQDIVASAASGLGVEGEVRAELYKLLVYEAGGFFVPHRDTEKAPGMFGTLILVLPSEYEGGELIVKHDGRETCISMCQPELGLVPWCAFYADCQHELRPVRSGHRLVLVYNLLRAGRGSPRVPDDRPLVASVAAALRDWAGDPEGPAKLVYPLTHEYSLTELAFATLKNEDAARAQVLVAAAEAADCVLRLAMVTIEGRAPPSRPGVAGGASGTTVVTRTRTTRPASCSSGISSSSRGGGPTTRPRDWGRSPSTTTSWPRRAPSPASSPTRTACTRPPATAAPATSAPIVARRSCSGPRRESWSCGTRVVPRPAWACWRGFSTRTPRARR